MRKLIFTILFILPFLTEAQTDTSKVEQYCEVVATGKLFSRKVSIEISFGDFQSIWKDNRLRTEEGRLRNFNNIVDALNYMGRIGWKLVNAFPINEGSGNSVYHFYFKKEFDKSELDINKQ
ncbi:MAG: hypothetical protein ACTHJ5_18855 [Ilyomonas sp.]